jgi:hypothetical protein
MDLVLKSNPVPHIKAEILLKTIRTLLLFSLAELGVLDEFAEETTLFLMDNHSNHILSVVIGLFPRHKPASSLLHQTRLKSFKPLTEPSLVSSSSIQNANHLPETRKRPLNS